MSDALEAALSDDVGRALQSGLDRAQPVDPARVALLGGGAESGEWALRAAALRAVAERFRRRTLPAFEEAATPSWASVRGVEGAAREALRAAARRGLFQGPLAPLAGRAVWGALGRAGRTLHPFDWALLEDLACSDAAPLEDPARLYFATRELSAFEGFPRCADDIDEGWAVVPIGARCDWIERLRGEDPAAARGLVEACIAGETAATRLRLVKTLRRGLCIEDRAFLMSLSSERSSKVRDAAMGLVKSIAASSQHEDLVRCSVQALAAQIVKSKKPSRLKGLVGRAPLEFQRNPSVDKVQEREEAIRNASFAPLELIAEKLGLEPAELVARAKGDVYLETLLLFSLTVPAARGGAGLSAEDRASFAGELERATWDDFLRRMRMSSSGPWGRNFELFAGAPTEGVGGIVDPAVVQTAADSAGGVLPEAFADWLLRLIGARGVDALAPPDVSETLAATALCLPPARRADFEALLDGLPAVETQLARSTFELLDELARP